MSSLPKEFLSTVFRLENAPDSLPRSFAITAWNPDGVKIDDDINKAADRELLAELQSRSVVHFKATGGSPPDLRAHHEDGWAAVIPKDEAIELGRIYRQLGIWWIKNDDLILVDCRTLDERRIGGFSEKIVRSTQTT